jgi:hypothetical protein
MQGWPQKGGLGTLRVHKKRLILAQHQKSVFARKNLTPLFSINS